MEQPPEEELGWALQPTDSLAFSVSPVGPSTINTNTVQKEGGQKNFAYTSASSQGDNDDDDDQPLVGEFIWGDAFGNGQRPEEGGDEVDHRYFLAAKGLSPHGHGEGESDTRSRVSRDREEDDLRESLSCRLKCEDSRASQDNSEGDAFNHDDRTNVVGRFPVGMDEADEGKQERRRLDDGGHQEHIEAPPRGREYPAYERDGMLHKQGWVDHGEFENFEEFAPAPDQGRPAVDSVYRFPEHSQGTSTPKEYLADYEPSSAHRQIQRHHGHGFAVGSDDVLHDESSEMSLSEEVPTPLSVRRRTRSSLHRERRNLDRIPRSQRLSRVRGHPLGGMTLLELEERHLLDVGIGQMTRLLAQGYDKRQRRADADLLRRSARLLRRTQEEREARLSFGDSHRTNSSRWHTNSSAVRDGSNRGAIGQGVREDGRPASASRGRPRAQPSSFSIGSDDSMCWVRATARNSRPRSTDRSTRMGGGTSPVGLYSGGGARCSLRRRRPTSAKPTLSCGSGWEPGQRRSRRGQENSGRRDSGSSSKGGGFGGRANDRTNDSVRGLEEAECSDLSDLSPHGIVEYDDEEEGPFNEDELERVAASYLLRPGSSFRRSSPRNDDEDRYAYDGSVYLYREGDSVGCSGDEQGDDAPSSGFEGGARPPRRTSSHNYDREWWDRSSTRENDVNSNRGERRRSHSFADHTAKNTSVHGGTVDRESSSTLHGGKVASCRRGSLAKMEGSTMTETTGSEGDDGAHLFKMYDGEDVEEGWKQLGCTEKGDLQGTPSESGRLSSDEQRNGAPRAGTWGSEGNDGDANDLSKHSSSHTGGDGEANAEQSPETLVPAPGDDGDTNSKGVKRERASSAKSDRNTAIVRTDTKQGRMAIRLRQMILDRQAATGRSLRQVFGHFDRRGCGYVNAKEMHDALVDLRISVTDVEAKEFLYTMALDGGDRASYAEFAVFVTDQHHSELETEVCRQAAERLEALGQRSFLLEAFRRRAAGGVEESTSASWSTGKVRRVPRRAASSNSIHEGHDTGGRGSANGHQHASRLDVVDPPERQENILSAREFLAGLGALGLKLSAADAKRLLVRFDVHGDGYLSVNRLASMVERSESWIEARAHLARQEEADEEAEAYLRLHAQPGKQEQGLSKDVLDMARYLGVRVSTDESMLWIASDALAAPLPDGWVAHMARGERWFFYNERTGESTWSHPLDPHFRQLYLRERFGSNNRQAEGSRSQERAPRAHDAAGLTIAPRAGNSTNTSRRLPTTLPPKRARPNVLDFSSDKALENLRTRRLNRTAAEPTAMAGTRAGLVSQDERASWTNQDLWTAKGTKSPPKPRRRRPVSASAIRESLDQPAAAQIRACDVDCCSPPPAMLATMVSREGERRTDSAAAMVRHRDETHRLGRPRSAKATLQRPPTDHRQSAIGYSEEELTEDQSQLLRMAAKQPTSDSEALNERRGLRVQRGASGGRRAANDECTLHNRTSTRGSGNVGYPHEGGEGGYYKKAIRRPAPAAATGLEAVSDGGETAGMSPAAAAERAWLLDRLARLCQTHRDAEGASGGQPNQRGPSAEAPHSGGQSSPAPHIARSSPDVGPVNDPSSELLGSNRVGSPRRGESNLGEKEYHSHQHHHNHQSSRRTGTLLRHQVVELGNRISELEARLGSQNQQSQSDGLLADHYRQQSPQIPLSSGRCAERGPAAIADPPCDTRSDQNPQHDRLSYHRRANRHSHRQQYHAEKKGDETRRFDAATTLRAGKNGSNCLSERWSYLEERGARVTASGAVFLADSASSSICSSGRSSASSLLAEKDGLVSLRDDGAYGLEAGGTSAASKRAASAARERGTSRRKSGNVPGIVLI